MKKTINIYDFRKAFEDFDRAENFSYEGLEALFEYLEELEEDTGDELELDVIAICCDFSEGTIAEFADYYDIESDDPDEIFEELNDNTTCFFVDSSDAKHPEMESHVIIVNY